MITIIKDMSTIVEERKNILWGKRKRTWDINRETILVEYPHELQQAMMGCYHNQFIRINGKIYEPLTSENSWRLNTGGKSISHEGKLYLLKEGK